MYTVLKKRCMYSPCLELEGEGSLEAREMRDDIALLLWEAEI
jgi:hypothetical protein